MERAWFTLNRTEAMPTDDETLSDLAARRAYQYFLDFSSREPESYGLPQDRSTFVDLLSVGGVGFALAGHVVAAERGWVTRQDAVTRTLGILRVLDDGDAFGPEPVGRIGYRGWFYHFLGIDGRRKLNFDVTNTPDDESLNTVEISTIDTGLALLGALVAQSYFDRDDPAEAEIRSHAQAIYDRVDWAFMTEPTSGQFYLGWKPRERRAGESFAFRDSEGAGAYSGTCDKPQTLDYYTDEALILDILAAGAGEDQVSQFPSSGFRELVLDNDQGLIRTYPGSLFTYEFLGAFLDTSDLPVPRPGDTPQTWLENSQTALRRAIEYATSNPDGFAAYGRDAWGVSAAEGPYDEYHAYGMPPLAASPDPEQDGTVTYYAMLSGASFGPEFATGAAAAIRAGWYRGHWHARFGLADAFNNDISQIPGQCPEHALRCNGPWFQRALFAIDQGSMLLHLDNAGPATVPTLLVANPNIHRALQYVTSPSAAFVRDVVDPRTEIEAESGAGDGTVMERYYASSGRTVLLHRGQRWEVVLPEDPLSTIIRSIRVRYSNGGDTPEDLLRLTIDGRTLAPLRTDDTGDDADGWNEFVTSVPLGSVVRDGRDVTFRVSVEEGDELGVEIDAIILDPAWTCGLMLPRALRTHVGDLSELNR